MHSLFRYLVQSSVFTVLPVVRLVSMAYWSTAASIIRRSLRIRLAWERLRARRKPGTAIAAKSAMIATTIMISTRVKPARRLLSWFNIANLLSVLYCLFDCAPKHPPRNSRLREHSRCQAASVLEFLESELSPSEPECPSSGVILALQTLR